MEDSEIRKRLSRNLKELMGVNNLSKAQLEKRSGVSTRMINYILNCERAASIEVIAGLARGLRVTETKLLEGRNGNYVPELSLADKEHMDLRQSMTPEEIKEVDNYADYLIKKRNSSS